jgi:type VI secretion system FHA domain protein
LQRWRLVSLTLTILRCPDSAAPEARELPGGEYSIGRGAENDWVLPDPERILSKRHCLLAYRAGGWQVADLSTNGTFLNGEAEPIGRGRPRDLRDGDRLRLGAYEIEIRIAEAPAALHGRAAGAEPFALDPFALRPAAPAEPFEDPLLPHEPPFAPGLASSAALPPDYDPLAPEPGEAPFAGPIQSDHSPHLEDAFRPAPPARILLPEDWDRDLMAQPAAAPVPPAAPPPAAPPMASIAAPSPPAAPAPVPPASAETPAGDLFAAFLRGIGLKDVCPADPAATMETLGAAFRTIVSGLRQALIARAAIKGEFRIEQTMIRARGNNPLKFSADDDDALLALLGVGRHSEMGVVEAVADALRDLRLHEVAVIAAMQKAVRALFERCDPAKLRLAAGEGGLSLVPMQKKARAWDMFEALYPQLTAALADDFDSVFGKAFARAYEQAFAEARGREDESGRP